MDERLGRSKATTHCRGNRRQIEVFVVAEHQSGPLPAGKPPQRLPSLINLRIQMRPRRSWRMALLHLSSSVMTARKVHNGLPDIAPRRRNERKAIPRCEECLLHEFLGDRLGPRQEVRKSDQPLTIPPVERLPSGIGSHHIHIY